MNNIGIDITVISRIEASLQDPRFLTRVFSEEEQAFLQKKGLSPASAAANFAAKEAFSKALGTGVRGFSLNEVSVLRHENGEPYLSLTGRAAALAEERGLSFRVSLTHDGGFACAVVAAEERKHTSLPVPSPERLLRLSARFGEDFSGAKLLTPERIRPLFKKREPDTHKGSYGKLLILSGSDCYRGAAALCTGAALRSGAGIVTLASVRPVIDAVSAKLDEPVYLPLPQNGSGTLSADAIPLLVGNAHGSSALLIGCGLGQSEDAAAAVVKLIAEATCPIVLDADGLNLLSGRIDILRTAKSKMILTPHLGEMARLCGLPIPAIKADPIGVAKAFAKEYGVTLVLKDAVTVVASPDGKTFLNTTGNAGMARGGSGDVLAGILAALLCQGFAPLDAASAGVFLHGAAGDLAARESSALGMLPSDIIRVLPRLYHFAEE